MKLEFELDEVKIVRNLIISRINELRYDMNEEDESSEDEIRNVIREYKHILCKIDDTIDKRIK
ncbi:MAG: hypothetical protein Q8936_10175 [Bacillota bacterium]|nr:hypothetical protein [Bacillota bacterium]